MNEKRFTWKTEKLQHSDDEVLLVVDNENKEWKGHILNIVDLLNEQQATILKLEEERGYWKSKAMTLLMQVRRLTPRMSAKEVIEFSKELEDE